MRSRLKNIKWKPNIFKKEYAPNHDYLKQAFSKKINLQSYYPNNIPSSFIGQGYINNIPNHFLTNSLIKNPKWHSAYAAYQSEISQGRLTIFNEYQNLIKLLTNKSFTNSSMLDESTAMVDAANMLIEKNKLKKVSIFAAENMYFYRKMVLKTFGDAVGWDIRFIDFEEESPKDTDIIITQTHDRYGNKMNLSEEWLNKSGGHIHILDPKYSLLYEPPKADIMVGSMQSFGLPLMAGGPHVGFIAADKEYLRFLPGKMVVPGVDKFGTPLLRLGLQTREQHIKRERAISNICTNQSLMASYVTCWTALQGFEKLTKDMEKIETICSWFNPDSMDTLTFDISDPSLFDKFKREGIEVYRQDKKRYSITLDWGQTDNEINNILRMIDVLPGIHVEIPKIEYIYKPKEKYLENEFFSKWNGDELGFARHLNTLAKKDFSLVDGLIPLGSCTMKYNPPNIFDPLDNHFLLKLHPISKKMEKLTQPLNNFREILKNFVFMDDCSFQPMSGSHGELTSLLMIKKYFQSKNENRNIILLPLSCHGTNSASCRMAGLDIVHINDLDKSKNFHQALLETLDKVNEENIAGFMVTFPNTFGFFDESIIPALKKMKEIGGISYLDGANMNSWIGMMAPGKIGFDIAHLNLHKTLAVPHGGGGPGAGPILCKDFLSPFLPNNYMSTSARSIGRVSSSPYGNSLAVLFSYLYTTSLGLSGILTNTEKALYNANYLKERLSEKFDIPYFDKDGLVSHELLLDTTFFFKNGIKEVDICKRLMDYGIHPPTVSWPIQRCFLVEPTESETTESLDYLVEVLEMIKKEAEEDPEIIKNAPYNLRSALESGKDINKLLFPHPSQSEDNKFWIPCSRVDESQSDRNALRS